MRELSTDQVMIEADGLSKRFGNVTAADDISFSLTQGEIVGFLGPNGAGKTTTMRLLTGYMPPNSGAAFIAGFNTLSESIEARQHLGYLPETVPLYPEMTIESYLAYVGRLRRVDDLWDRVDAVLEAVDMLDRAETHIGKLSKGMRQRVGLAQALIHDPDVLILDEPTIGLDPAQVREVRALIGELGKRHTILLSTHILSEVEQICNRVIMIIDGRIWADMPLSEAMGGGDTSIVTLKVARPSDGALDLLANIPGVNRVNPLGQNEFTLEVDGRDETRTAVAASVVESGWGLLELSGTRMSLETVFLNKIKEAESTQSIDEPDVIALGEVSSEEPDETEAAEELS